MGGPLLYLVALVVVALGFGILSIYFDNEQKRIGDQIRRVEKDIVELGDKNSSLLSEISNLVSRDALSKKVDSGALRLHPIAESAVRHVGGQRVASMNPSPALQAAR